MIIPTPTFTLRNLCVLCASAVHMLCGGLFTAETQRTQRLRREGFKLGHYPGEVPNSNFVLQCLVMLERVESMLPHSSGKEKEDECPPSPIEIYF
jgi:hypothetical protein